MPDHETRAEIRNLRIILERIDRDLAGHIRRDHERDMRNADNKGRLRGRLERSLVNLGTLIRSLETKLERQAARTDS